MMDRVDGGSILELKDVRKAFGALNVIQGVNLTVRQGERHAVIGPNGAGKSTLFGLISGSLPVSSGDISFKGRSLLNEFPYAINRMGVGRSFQITNIFGKLSVFESVRIGILARHGVRFGVGRWARNMSAINDETMALIDEVGLAHKANISGRALSYAEQRALEIAVALTTNPDLLLLDEPTAGMSSEETARATQLINRMTEGRTLLMVEHDMDVVFGLCDRISVLVYGTILASGSPEDVKNNPEVQKAYLGDFA